MPRIVVVGSANMDLIVKVPRLPVPGETLPGGVFLTAPGGKGANQAVAAARLGAEVVFVGRLGADAFGEELLTGLRRDGIDPRYVIREGDAPSGVALIFVGAQGENMIAVAPGANGRLRPEDVPEAAFDGAAALLVQLEVPLETVERAVEIARRRGVRAILNPAPAQTLEEALLRRVDVLTPNEIEASGLTGVEVRDRASAEQVGRMLLGRGVGTVVATMGSQGALLIEPQGAVLIPAPTVEAIDTTAAGDAFNGALAVALAEGMGMREAVAFANRVGALSVTRMGAQPSMPRRDELDQRRHSSFVIHHS